MSTAARADKEKAFLAEVAACLQYEKSKEVKWFVSHGQTSSGSGSLSTCQVPLSTEERHQTITSSAHKVQHRIVRTQAEPHAAPVITANPRPSGFVKAAWKVIVNLRLVRRLQRLTAFLNKIGDAEKLRRIIESEKVVEKHSGAVDAASRRGTAAVAERSVQAFGFHEAAVKSFAFPSFQKTQSRIVAINVHYCNDSDDELSQFSLQEPIEYRMKGYETMPFFFNSNSHVSDFITTTPALRKPE